MYINYLLIIILCNFYFTLLDTRLILEELKDLKVENADLRRRLERLENLLLGFMSKNGAELNLDL